MPACRELGDLAAAHEHVEASIDGLARVEHVDARQQEVRGLARALDERMRGTSCELWLRRAYAGAAQKTEQDRHADRHARLDLSGDQRLGRVQELTRELDTAVDRAGVHEHLARG